MLDISYHVIASSPRLSKLEPTSARMKMALQYSDVVEYNPSTQQLRASWNIQEFTEHRIQKSTMRLKNLPTNKANQEFILDLLKQDKFTLRAISIFLDANQKPNGSATGVALTEEQAVEMEKFYSEKPLTYEGTTIEIVRSEIHESKKKQQPTQPKTLTLTSSLNSSSDGQSKSLALDPSQLNLLQQLKQQFPWFADKIRFDVISLRVAGPYKYIATLEPCSQVPQLKTPLVIEGNIVSSKKAALRIAEYNILVRVYQLINRLDPETNTPISDDSFLVHPNSSIDPEQRSIAIMEKRGESKRLSNIFREIGASMAELENIVNESDNLVRLFGSRRCHTPIQSSVFNTALSIYQSLSDQVITYLMERDKYLKEKGIYGIRSLTPKALSALASTVAPQTSNLENLEPHIEDVGGTDDQIEDISDDDKSNEESIPLPKIVEAQVQIVLEAHTMSFFAKYIQVGYRSSPNNFSWLWKTTAAVRVSVEELTPRLNIEFMRHNIKYKFTNLLKHVHPIMWIETDLGLLPGDQELDVPPSMASSSATKGPLPTYLDLFIPVDSSPQLTRQEHYQSKPVGSWDFTSNAAFGQSTIYHLHFDIAIMEFEEIVIMLSALKTLVEIGLLNCKVNLEPSNFNALIDNPNRQNQLQIEIGESSSLNNYHDVDGLTPLASRMHISQADKESPYIPPPNLLNIDFWVRWKLLCLVTANSVRIQQIDADLVNLILKYPRETSFKVLSKLESARFRLYNFFTILESRLGEYSKGIHIEEGVPLFDLNQNFVSIGHISVSPLEIRCEGPIIEISNRLLRSYEKYKERFVRIAFKGPCFGGLTGGNVRNGGRLAIRHRIGGMLRNGLNHTAIKALTGWYSNLEFLLSSSSQLRTHKAWFFAPPHPFDSHDPHAHSPYPNLQLSFESTSSLNIASHIPATAFSVHEKLPLSVHGIRSWLGEFSPICNVAMYCARLGQGMSSTYHCFEVEQSWIKEVPDVQRNGYTFSDGCAAISVSIAKRAATMLGLSTVPSAYQIRMGGVKGMVSVDPTLDGDVICIRPSMVKFKAPQQNIFEVCTWSRKIPAHLNKQVIQILSSLGIQDEVFMKLQSIAFDKIRSSISFPPLENREEFQAKVRDLTKRWENSSSNSPEGRSLAMLQAGFHPANEPFLRSLLTAIALNSLQDIRMMARIPVDEGQYAIGIMDETGLLPPGAVFFQRTISEHSTHIHEGPICISRSPSLHPGDVRFVPAINIPELHHLVDVLVFPQTGDRPIPDECSGGDLDGDQYLLLWGSDFDPPKKDTAPYFHESSTQSSKSGKDDNEVLPEEMEHFFVNYIFDDKLSQIADAHTYWADQSDLGVFDSRCLALAAAHNIAVDSPKTGKIVPSMPELRVPKWPDFMNLNQAHSYLSKKVLGKLYRSAEATFSEFNHRQPLQSNVPFDNDMIVEGYQEYLQQACDTKLSYNLELSTLLDQYRIGNESSYITGNVSCNYRSEKKAWEGKKEGFEMLGAQLRSSFRSTFGIPNSKLQFDEGYVPDPELLKKASAWYYVNFHPEYQKSTTFWSMPWVVPELLCYIKKQSVSRAIATQQLREQTTEDNSLQIDAQNDSDMKEEHEIRATEISKEPDSQLNDGLLSR